MIVAIAGGVQLAVHVVPNASRTAVAGVHGDAIKVRVAAPAIDGRANDALVEFLAERLSVSRTRVVIVRGMSSRRKIVAVQDVDARAAESCLLPR